MGNIGQATEEKEISEMLDLYFFLSLRPEIKSNEPIRV